MTLGAGDNSKVVGGATGYTPAHCVGLTASSNESFPLTKITRGLTSITPFPADTRFLVYEFHPVARPSQFNRADGRRGGKLPLGFLPSTQSLHDSPGQRCRAEPAAIPNLRLVHNASPLPAHQGMQGDAKCRSENVTTIQEQHTEEFFGWA